MMNAMLQNKIQETHGGGDASPTKQHGSPVKGMMNALSKHNEGRASFTKAITKEHSKKGKGLSIPTNIEEVPFRRQDRRIINGRKKRTRDRQIIKCAMSLTVLLLLVGAGMISLFIIYGNSDGEYIFMFLHVKFIQCMQTMSASFQVVPILTLFF